MAELPLEQIEVVGDAEALPDAFFEALAALLLSLDAQCERVPGDKEVA